MTDATNNPGQTSKSPTLIAYTVRDREGKDAIWTRIGAVWPHKQGKGGSTLQLEAVPLDGRIVLLPPSERKD